MGVRRATMAMLVAAVLAGGCNDPIWRPGGLLGPRPAGPGPGQAVEPEPVALRPPICVTAATPRGDEPDPLASQVAFYVLCDVWLIESPAGVLSANADLWGHLREDAFDVRTADHLARNGFRVGVGGGADLPQVDRLIRELRNVQVTPVRLQFTSRSCLEVFVAPEVRAQRAFVFSADGAISGEDFQPSVNVYWVAAWHQVEQIDAVSLQLTPEIRWGRVRERYYHPGMRREEDYRNVGRLFDEVTIDLTLSRGQFMVVAPNPKAQPALVLGRVFLAENKAGQVRERALLIRPRVVRAPNT